MSSEFAEFKLKDFRKKNTNSLSFTDGKCPSHHPRGAKGRVTSP